MRASLLLALAAGRAAAAPLSFARSLGDHMVLQREPASAVVWGYCSTPGAAVAVDAFGAQAQNVTCDAGGAWKAILEPMPATATPGAVRVASGDEAIALSGVVVGDVFLCSGQSNMEMGVAAAFDNETAGAQADDAASAGHGGIRLMWVANTEVDDATGAAALDDVATLAKPWTVASAATVAAGYSWDFDGAFSATCWCVGRVARHGSGETKMTVTSEPTPNTYIDLVSLLLRDDDEVLGYNAWRN